MAESTLLFEHSQRESSAAILACSIDKSSGNFVTYDESAVRLWSLKKMIKSTRIEKNPEQVFLDLLCVEKIEKVLVVFTQKQSSTEKGGAMHILSLGLAHIQSVDLHYYPIYRVSWSPSQSEVIIVDKNRTIFAIHMESSVGARAISAERSKPKSAAEMYHPKKPKVAPCLKMHEVQALDSRKSSVVDVLMINDNVFAVMGSKTIKLFSRPQLVYVPPVVPAITGATVDGPSTKSTKKRWQSKKEKAAAAAAACLEAEATPNVSEGASLTSAVVETKYNEFALSGKLNIFQGASRTRAPKDPVILRLLSKDKLLVGFDDGSAQILFSPELLDPATTRPQQKGPAALQISLGDARRGEDESKTVDTEPAKGTMAAVLCEFQAHFVAERGYRASTADADDRARSSPLRGLSVNGDAAAATAGGDAADDLSEPDLHAYDRPVKSNPFGLRTALVCPWGACSGGPGLGYQFELITVGSDRRIAHWGVRYKPGQSDVVLVPHYSSATRASTALEKGTINDDVEEAEEEPMGFDDSMQEDSCYSRPGTRSANDVPMEADMLGEYQLPLEPPSAVPPAGKQAHTKIMATAFELSLLRNPVCKKVLCIVGGMLLFFDALQPHRIVVGRKDPEMEKTALGVGIGTVTKVVRASRNDVSSLEMGRLIIASAKGPMLAQFLNRLDGGFKDAMLNGAREDVEQPQSTVLVLREHGIELVLLQTGQVLQYFSTANLHEAVLLAEAAAGNAVFMETGSPSKKGMGRQGHAALATSLVRNSSINHREVRAAEGKPSTVHWCPITHLILVGYTTGGVGMLAPSGVVHSTFASVPAVVHLQANTQHGAEITRMITLHHRLVFKSAAPGGPPSPRDIVLALVGDANGVISLWQLYPAITGKASPLISSCQAHAGRIVYAHSCLMDENNPHRIIVTACSSGMMKAWKLEGNGTLTLTAFFQADLNGAKLSAALAIPCAYYEVKEKDDDSISVQSAMSVASAVATNMVATLHHEIFCVIGLTNGVVESWLLSDNKRRSQGTAMARFQDQYSAITQIARHPSKASLPTSLRNHAESVFALVEPNAPIVCFSEEGVCCVVKMNDTGLFKRSSYFLLPAPINSAICLFSPPVNNPVVSFDAPSAIGSAAMKWESMASTAVTSVSNAIPPPVSTELNLSPPVIECAVFGDFKVYHTLPVVPIHVPAIWHRPFAESLLVQHQRNFGPLGASKYFKQTLSLVNSPAKTRGGGSPRRRLGSPSAALQSSLNDSLNSSFMMLGDANNRMYNSDLAISPNANVAAVMAYDRNSDQYPRSPYEGMEQAEVDEALEMQRQAEQGTDTDVAAAALAPTAGLVQESLSTLQSQSATDDRRSYVGPMESMQRIVSSELHFAKKDGRLLELFAQHEPAADGTVSPETTVEIVYAWFNASGIARENIWELFRLLEIQNTDRLRFVEVAKIAAVVTSAMHRSAAQKPITKGYSQMKAYTTKVTYNSMGEKSVERILLSKGTHEGIYKGFASTIRKVWKQQPPRIVTQAEVKSLAPKPMPVILTEIPKSFEKVLPKGASMPATWSPDHAHWFHPLRVIRIARTLLDIRSAKQHEVFFSSALFQSSSADVTPLSSILVNYFERNYGDAGNMINLSRHKITHFLEALCQYKHHPIVNILQSMLHLDPALQENHPALATETATWLCVETRSTLCARGCVVSGELIQPYGEDLFGGGTTKDGAALQARWQYVPRADALLIADEMLRERGKFGPGMYEQILRMISDIPAVDSYTSADGQVRKTDTTSPLIDLERFLELLYHEYLRCDQLVRQYEVSVFGEASMSSAVSAQSRDIVRGGKRKLIMDDSISAFGPYHDVNLSKIRSWLLEFEPFDPLRTGMVSQEVLTRSVHRRAETIDFLGPNNTPADIYRFVAFCKNRFVMNDPDGRVSYIDMFALLCAWEWQTQGNEVFLLSTLNKSLPGIHRTIETSFAENLLLYFAHMSATPDADPIWVMGPAPEGVDNPYATKGVAKSSLSLARDGFWNVQSNAPQEAPGLLTVQKEPIHTGTQVSVLPKQSAVRRERSKLSTDAIPSAPQVLQSDRVRTSLYGETIQPIRPLTVAPLTLKLIDAPELRGIDQDVREREQALSRASYSRSMENISSLTYQPSLSLSGDLAFEVDSLLQSHHSPADLLLAPRPKTPEEIRSSMDERHRASSYAEMEEMASQFLSLEASSLPDPGLREDSLTLSQSVSNASGHQYPPNLLGSFTGSAYESLDPTLVKKSLAEEEVRRLRREQRERERELELLQRAEQEEMRKRREEKLAMRELIQQEMRRKERAGMAYYRAAVNMKFQHNEKVRARMSDIAAAEEADKRQKELEIERIKQQNMTKSLEKVAHKNSAAEEEMQLKRERHEIKLMRKEDEAMRKIAKALDREAKKAREEQSRLEKEAADLQSAELIAQYAASQTDTADATITDAPMHTDAEFPQLEPGGTEEDPDVAEEEEHGDGDGDGDEDDNDAGEEQEGEEDEEGEGGDDEEGAEEEADASVEVKVGVKEEQPAQVEESPELTEAERERLEQEAEEELRKKQSAGQQRLQEFLDKIKESVRRHASHPRRKPRHFFMPMMFSEDIYYDPFETVGFELEIPQPSEETDGATGHSTTEQQQQPTQQEDDEEDPTSTQPVDPFADVNLKLGEFRKEEERKRKLLFATTLQEIPAKDWIQVFRTYTVDWDSFFASQDAMVELSAAVRESDQEIEDYFHNTDPLKKITDTLSVSPARSRAGSHHSLHSLGSSTGYLSGTATPDEGDAPTVTLLPYGKILEHQKVRQGDYRYFRLEQLKQSSMLTVEVQCLSGLVDVYLAHQKLPSLSMHDRHVACTKENKGVVRLAFRPQKSGTFFISVRSHATDAKFNIWTYPSSGAAQQSPIIARVNTIIRKFEILATVDEEKLQEFYPKYEREALAQVHEEEAARARAEAEARLRGPRTPNAQVVDDDASLNELYDIENVNSFIMKVSKYTLMGDEAAALYGDGGLEEQLGFDLDYEDDDPAQEYGQEIEDLFMPMLGTTPSNNDLRKSAAAVAATPSSSADQRTAAETAGTEFLPSIQRGYSLPSLHQVKSDITLDSYLGGEEDNEEGEGLTAAERPQSTSLRLPGIKGATDASSSFSTKRSIPRSRSSINVAREYAALDHALTKALRNKPEKKARIENPLLHQTLKPIKYQLRGNYPI